YEWISWLAGGAAQSLPCIACMGSRLSQVVKSREWTVTSQLAGCHGCGAGGLPSKLSTNASSVNDTGIFAMRSEVGVMAGVVAEGAWYVTWPETVAAVSGARAAGCAVQDARASSTIMTH